MSNPNAISDRLTQRWTPYVLVALIGVTTAVLGVATGFPCPQVDDAIYKSPAAELVQHGRFAIPCGTGYFARAGEVFACYPPIFPLVISAWYRVFDFSLSSSLAFMYAIHLGTALLLMTLAERWSGDCDGISRGAQRYLVSVVGLTHISNLAFFDRQEELALLFVLLQLLFVRQVVLCGILLGIAGLTSPWVGILGTLVFVGNQLVLWWRGEAALRGIGRQLAVGGLAALLTAGSWFAYMEWSHPGIINDQFLGHMRHLRETQIHDGLLGHLKLLVGSLLYDSPHLLAGLSVLVMFPLAVRELGGRRFSALALAVYGACCLGILAASVLRPKAYTYLGVAQMLLLPCLVPAVGRYFSRTATGWNWEACVAAVVLLAATVFSFKDTVRVAVGVMTLPAAEQRDTVEARLAAVIPPGERVAVTARHWHLFQGRNPWREAYFVSIGNPDEIRGCEWLVLRPGIGLPPFIDEFELVEEQASNAHYNRTYAYSVWRPTSPAAAHLEHGR